MSLLESTRTLSIRDNITTEPHTEPFLTHYSQSPSSSHTEVMGWTIWTGAEAPGLDSSCIDDDDELVVATEFETVFLI